MKKERLDQYKYLPADDYIVFHEEDPDLEVIRIRLPRPPALSGIDGFGIAPAKQKFTRPKMPPKLAKLQEKSYTDVQDYWDELAENYDYYKEELWFIEQHWDRRLNGYWCFINGKPTYLDGWHYYYLTACDTENENGDTKPSYRDRDRKFFIAARYAATTKQTIFHYRIIKDNGKIEYTSDIDRVREAMQVGFTCEESSVGYIVDLNGRTVFGITWNKMRREGASTRACAINLEMTTRAFNKVSGMQSKTEEDAKKIYTGILLRMWRGLPFYFIPINDNNPDPQTALRFKPQSKKGAVGAKSKRLKALYSEVVYRSSSEGAFDGSALYFYHGDEVGKTDNIDVARRHNITKQALSTGSNKIIRGFTVYTSTVGDMNKEAGINYKIICNQSHFNQRSDIGQTISGLINFYIPSDEGLEGFIDEYGNSMKAEARAHILAQRKAFLDAKDDSGYVEYVRQTPLRWKECFMAMAGNSRFNTRKISERLGEFAFKENPFLQKGTLKWEGPAVNKNHMYSQRYLPTPEDVMAGKAWIVFIPTPDLKNFDWEISYLPPKLNHFKVDPILGIVPGNTRDFSYGIDTYKMREKTTSNRASLGAGAIFRKENVLIDHPDVDPMKLDENGDFVHKTNRFCATYLKRPDSKEEYMEQMLMAAIIYGTKAFPELNIPDVWAWFAQRGFGGYLQFKRDLSGKQSDKPGATTGTTVLHQIFNDYGNWVEKHCGREHHLSLLQQILEIETDMNDFDLFAAGGYAFLGTREYIDEESFEDSLDLSDFVVQQYV